MVCILALLALGCGQEDPGGDGVAVDGDFFPMVDGASWTYAHTGGSTPWDEEVSLTSMEYEGEPAMLLADSEGPSGSRSESVLRARGDDVVRVHKEVFFGEALDISVDYDPGFTRFRPAWLSEKVGFTETLSYERTEFDSDGEMTRMGMRTHRFTIEATSVTVDVPAGRLVNCLQLLRERIRAAGDALVEGDVKQFWFCPGVGKTKEIDQVSGKIEELIRCDIEGGECP